LKIVARSNTFFEYRLYDFDMNGVARTAARWRSNRQGAENGRRAIPQKIESLIRQMIAEKLLCDQRFEQ
jgi:hypothetical protein